MTTRLARTIPTPISLAELQRIKKWQMAHQAEHPVEYELWQAVMTVWVMGWVMGWVGWLPALAYDAWWAMPVCALAMAAPGLYIAWRAKAHATQRLRCEWLGPAA